MVFEELAALGVVALAAYWWLSREAEEAVAKEKERVELDGAAQVFVAHYSG